MKTKQELRQAMSAIWDEARPGELTPDQKARLETLWAEEEALFPCTCPECTERELVDLEAIPLVSPEVGRFILGRTASSTGPKCDE